ncbi:MAG: DUF503 domain-containing protein [Caldicoprobacterales bacterium]|jgi:uncharacterized protein YlxP (DUF503 family)
MRMFVAIAEIDIRLYNSQSLKEKRQILKSLVSKIRNQFNVSIAEIDGLDTWQRASLGFACVANNSVQAEKQMNRVLEYIEQDIRLEVVNIRKDIL